MNLQNRIISQVSESVKTSQASVTSLVELIEAASQLLVNSLLNDKKILTCGNGHLFFCPELFSSLMLDQFERHRPSLPVIALTSDIAAVEYSQFDDIFAKQIRSLGQNGDLLVVFSDGKHSPVIARAINAAHEKQILVIALTSNQSDKIGSMLNENDVEIRVPSISKARIQEAHLLIIHCLSDLIDYQLFEN
jgi:D-sedoheptulose 7-phosphate isomerase